MNIRITYALPVFLVLSAVLTAACGPPSAPSGTPSNAVPSASNGERIYDTSTSISRGRITYSGGPGMMMSAGLACVNCHGKDGRGGTVSFMMQTYTVPGITWPDLTGPDPDIEHAPYTEETLKQAITQGVDPGGGRLEYPMPLWRMSASDLDDLVAFIKTLN